MSKLMYKPGVRVPGMCLLDVVNALSTFNKLSAQTDASIRIMALHIDAISQKLVITIEHGALWCIEFNNSRFNGDYRIYAINPIV